MISVNDEEDGQQILPSPYSLSNSIHLTSIGGCHLKPGDESFTEISKRMLILQ